MSIDRDASSVQGPASATARAVRRQERQLTATLAAWGALSVLAGAWLWVRGRHADDGDAPMRVGPVQVGPGRVGPIRVGPGRVGPVPVGPVLVGLGRQAVGWGAVDLALAGWALTRPRPVAATSSAVVRRARRLAAVTGANAVADVGYLAVAAALVRSPPRRGDAIGVAVQAIFLLLLDSHHASRFARHARAARSLRAAERLYTSSCGDAEGHSR